MRVLFVLLASAGLAAAGVASASAQVPEALAGRWSGAAVTDGVPRLFDLELAVQGDSLAAVLTQPYDGFARFPYPFAYEPGRADGELVAGLFGDEMRLIVDLGDATVRGTVVSGGDTTATVFLQRVLDVPLPVVRAEPVALPVGADTLEGRWLRPAGAGPFPAVVLVAGRGGSAADLLPWGERLARVGVAALALSPRGAGGSTGDAATTTDRDRFAELGAALDWAAARPDVHADRLGVLSYSAGAWVVPPVVVDRSDVAFWVSLVGPAESLTDQQGHVTTAFMRASGEAFTEAEYAEAFAYQAGLVTLAQRGAPWSAFEAGNAAARASRWAEHALIPDSLDQEDLSYYRRRAGFDARAALARLRVPTLAVFGGADPIVPPEPNAELWRTLAREAGNDALTVVVLDGADHGLGRPGGAVGEGPWPAGYTRSWSRPAALFETVLAWVRERAGVAQSSP